MNKVNIYATVLLGLLTLVMMQTQPVWALDGSGIGAQIATAIRGVIVEIINIRDSHHKHSGSRYDRHRIYFLGLGLRQEFLGFSLSHQVERWLC
jgi:hypothetical protein